MQLRNGAGFTLAGFLTVIVGIGLLAGVALVGFNLARTSEISIDVSDVEKYRAATQAFRQKYGYLPGDIPAALAMQLKFKERAGTKGRGDGNGLVEGYVYSHDQVAGTAQTGEPLFFWEDLSSSMFVNASFDSVYDSEPATDITATGGFLPAVAIGNGNSLYVYSDKSVNYFGLSAVKMISASNGVLTSAPGLKAAEAYDIDRKIDDGRPLTGKVLARYVNGDVISAPSESASSNASCYNSVSAKYSISETKETSANCALSFAFE